MAIAKRPFIIGAILVVAAAAQSIAASPSADAAVAYSLPPVNAKFDYQIGAAYTPPSGVTVVSRDRTAAPAAGLYNICYVNAFQTQPSEIGWWQANHDNLLLKDAGGKYVVDEAWGENLLDTSTAAKRSALAGIVGGWIDGCGAAGFKAIEPDNIDSYDRSNGLLTKANALSYLTLLASRAHRDGLAIGQKNTTDLGTAGKSAGLDFAIAEECGRYTECGDYTGVYGTHLIDIEYNSSGFTKACNAVGATVSVVRRDVNVTAPGSGTYVYNAC
jgi:hypothetical protein